jgi:GNAT superfamily N-acetyltransferase
MRRTLDLLRSILAHAPLSYGMREETHVPARRWKTATRFPADDSDHAHFLHHQKHFAPSDENYPLVTDPAVGGEWAWRAQPDGLLRWFSQPLPVAYAATTRARYSCDLLHFSVDDRLRGRGIGRQMMVSIEQHAAWNYSPKVTAIVRERRTYLQRFLCHMGYQAVAVLPGYFEHYDEDGYLFQRRIVCREQIIQTMAREAGYCIPDDGTLADGKQSAHPDQRD